MIFGSTVYTLWLRELKRFARNKSRLIGSLSMPILFLFVMGSGFGGFFRYRTGVSYMEFIGPGIVGMTLLFTSMFGGLSVLWDKQFGFLKEILVAPVSRIGIMAGMTAGTVTTSMLKATLILAILLLGGLVKSDVFSILLALVFMSLVSAAFVAVGIAFASRMTDPHGFQLIMNFLIMPVFFLSGALFPLEHLPDWLLVLTYLDPLTYGVDGLRFALGGPYHFAPLFNLVILMGFLVVATIAGASLFKSMSA
jgi:ABC-2 type transport system permease protein